MTVKSPFPGMDPYLEHPEVWPEVHTTLITTFAELLNGAFGPGYWAGVERRVVIETALGDEVARVRPDVSVESSRRSRTKAGRLQSEDPQVVAIRVAIEDPFDEPYLVIRDTESRTIVTVVELISPTNKLPGAGRAAYLDKRNHVLCSKSSLVEIDLLRNGKRLPFTGKKPPGGYWACWFPSWERPNGWGRAWGIREPLPDIPVPLKQEDGSTPLNLRKALSLAYERHRYDRHLDYSRPPVPPLDADDDAWRVRLTSGARS